MNVRLQDTARPPRRMPSIGPLVAVLSLLLLLLPALLVSSEAVNGGVGSPAPGATAADTPEQVVNEPAAGGDGADEEASGGEDREAEESRASGEEEAEAPPVGPHRAERTGWMLKIHLPIDAETHRRVQRFVGNAKERAAALGQRPVLIFQLTIAPGQTEFGRGSQFGPAYQLANFLSGPKLSEATTVAFIPESIQGHAVLVALACDEIIMAAEAEFGLAGVDEPIVTQTIAFAYEEIAGRHRNVPADVAMALVDPAREVLQVETEISTEYVSPDGLDELSQRWTIQSDPVVLIRSGEPGRFTGSEARRHGFVDYLADSPRDVARALDLRPESVREDPSLGDTWRAVQVTLHGPIDAKAADTVQELIEEAIRERKVNFVCLRIDSLGGSVTDSIRLANFLAEDLDPSQIRTVAYVSGQAGSEAGRASSDAALVALACDQVVLGPGATLGGASEVALSEEEVEQLRNAVRQTIAPRKGRSWSLPAALFDPELEVFSCSRRNQGGYPEYFCDEEIQQQPRPEQWEKGAVVTTAGQALSLDAEQAKQYWLADDVVDNFDEFKQIHGLEDDPYLLEPDWVDFLVDALASPGVAVLLLIVGFMALYIEMQMPGIGVGGFAAAVCFLLFFWNRFLGGTVGWLEVSLFIAGVTCILLEVFVIPGFGVFGLGGGMMVLLSLLLASQKFIVPSDVAELEELRGSMLLLVGAGVGTLGLIVLTNRWLPRMTGMGDAAVTGGQGVVSGFDNLLGTRGTTKTQLAPSGKARFEGLLVDVIAADCEIVANGVGVEVIEVQGNRVFVREVEET